MCPSCRVEKEFNEISNASSKKVKTNYDCNYADCKYTLLPNIQYSHTSSDNWFNHSCQNKYDISKYYNEFDTIHGLKKRCKNCVDKMIQKFVNTINKCSKYHHLLENINQPEIVIEFALNLNKPILIIMKCMRVLITMI